MPWAGKITRDPIPSHRTRDSEPLHLFAVTAPGLANLCAEELRERGVVARAILPGGVEFSGDLSTLYAANLHLRTASRVLLRVGEFHAATFHELERRAREIEWPRFVNAGDAVSVRVTCHKSRLYHSGAVQQRIHDAIQRAVPSAQLGARNEEGEGEEGEAAGPGQLLLVRFDSDRCLVSADSSGELLHRRGYRVAGAAAPLRETLAAALLLAAAYDPDLPLLDPLCGSGTLLIEAAWIARHIAPGSRRGFRFERWRDFAPAPWARLVAAARAEELPACPSSITGSDEAPPAIAAATTNAARAGVGDDIVLREATLADTAAAAGRSRPPPAGLIATNPPYGVRVGERRALGRLYAQLGGALRAHGRGWRLALLSPDPALDRPLGTSLRVVANTTNGGLRVRLLVGGLL